MNIKDIFLTASANLFRSKLRTSLTILAIFIGAFTLTLTNGIGAGISSYIDRQVNTLGQSDVLTITIKAPSSALGNSDTPQKYEPGTALSASGGRGPTATSTAVLTAKDIETLKTNTDLKDVTPSFGVNPDFIAGKNGDKFKLTSSPLGGAAVLDLAAGSQLDENSSENQIVLPISYVSALGYDSTDTAIGQSVTIAVSDAFGLQHTVATMIVGIQQKGLVSSSGAALNQALTRNTYDAQTIGLPEVSKNKFASASARITGDITDARVKEVKDKLDRNGFSSQTANDTLGTFKTVISALTFVLNGFAVIALLAASFGIVNTLLMSVQERTKEIGLMKAMGMRSHRIFLLFSTEAVLIGFWGSAIGVGLAVLSGQLINTVLANGLLKDLPGFNLLAFTGTSITSIILLIMAIAFLAGTLPAQKASKQNPIDALRYE